MHESQNLHGKKANTKIHENTQHHHPKNIVCELNILKVVGRAMVFSWSFLSDLSMGNWFGNTVVVLKFSVGIWVGQK